MLPNPQESACLARFTEEILNGKIHFLCSVFVQVFVRCCCSEVNSGIIETYKTEFCVKIVSSQKLLKPRTIFVKNSI